MDPRLNELLKWSVQNTNDATNNSNGGNGQTSSTPSAGAPNTEALNALFGGPSDAELMKAAMSAITSKDDALSNKLTAFDDLEQLVESIDNANNLAALNLWNPLIEQLQHQEADMRRMAAWCVGTAVQNNSKAQGHALSQNVPSILLEMVLHDDDPNVRRKAMYALSSAVRNHQPSLDALVAKLPSDLMEGIESSSHDAGDMEVVDRILAKLRERSQTVSP